MKLAPVGIHLVARETLRVSLGRGTIDAGYYENDGELMVVLPDHGMRDGEPWHLSVSESEILESEIREKLGVRRWLGLPVGRRVVHIQRERHAS